MLSVPLFYSEHQTPMVELSVANASTHFKVDTGTPFTSVLPSQVEEWGLSTEI